MPAKLVYLAEEVGVARPVPVIESLRSTRIVKLAVICSPTSRRTLAVPGSVPETAPSSMKISPDACRRFRCPVSLTLTVWAARATIGLVGTCAATLATFALTTARASTVPRRCKTAVQCPAVWVSPDRVIEACSSPVSAARSVAVVRVGLRHRAYRCKRRTIAASLEYGLSERAREAAANGSRRRNRNVQATSTNRWMRGPSTPLRGALLGLLLERPGHGGELVSRLKGRLGETWRINYDDVYRLLKRLEEEGLASSRDEPKHDNRRGTHVVYHPTDRTRAAVETWMETLLPREPVRLGLQAKLAVADARDVPRLRARAAGVRARVPGAGAAGVSQTNGEPRSWRGAVQ